uniref:Uncharacterized protein n=1 Tax=Timema monikensis TaxID=170555 RepID=A0A7R9EB13_9NEOP|nr:unnamed protein product [Timema monikensis]
MLIARMPRTCRDSCEVKHASADELSKVTRGGFGTETVEKGFPPSANDAHLDRFLLISGGPAQDLRLDPDSRPLLFSAASWEDAPFARLLPPDTHPLAHFTSLSAYCSLTPDMTTTDRCGVTVSRSGYDSSSSDDVSDESGAEEGVPPARGVTPNTAAPRKTINKGRWSKDELANALVVSSPTAEDGEIEVRISVG